MGSRKEPWVPPIDAACWPYAAPELWNFKPFTEESDVWSAGCVVYEMLKGEKAFPGSGAEVIYKILNKDLEKEIDETYAAGQQFVLSDHGEMLDKIKMACNAMLRKCSNERPTFQQVLISITTASNTPHTTAEPQVSSMGCNCSYLPAPVASSVSDVYSKMHTFYCFVRVFFYVAKSLFLFLQLASNKYDR